MPRGPKGEKRPADVIGAAVMVARLSVGDLQEELYPTIWEGPEWPRRGGGSNRKACS